MSEQIIPMNNDKNGIEKTSEGILLAALLIRHKWFILLFTLVGTLVATIIAFIMPNWYSATANVVPPKSTSLGFEGMMNNLSSTLKDIGLTKLGGKGEGAYSLLVILDSRTVKDSIIKKYKLMERYEIESGRMVDVRKAFEENLEIEAEKEGNYTITITDKDPKVAAMMANDYVQIANGLAQNIFNLESRVNREYLQKRINATEENISRISDSIRIYSQSKLIFSPQDQAKALSTALIDLKAELMKQEIILDLLTNKYGKDDPYTMMQAGVISQLKTQLSNAQNQPGFGGNFALNKAAEVGIEFMRLYAEFETMNKVKAFLIPMLEEARLNEIRQTQSLFIVDKAIPPDKKIKPKRSLIIIGSAVGIFLLSVIFTLVFNSFKSFSKQVKIINSENNN